MDLKNKTVIVTGGGNGIGREIVLQLLKKGAKVAAIDLRREALDETAGLAGKHRDRLSTHLADLTDHSAVEALPEEIVREHGHLDGLINNAGIIQPFVRVQDLKQADIDRVMNVNFFAMLNMVRACLPYLREREKAFITNVSSMGGFLPVPGQTIYGASKAAVKLFSEGLREELINTGVRVSVVFPGSTNTNITVNSGVDSPQMDVEDAGNIPIQTPAKAASLIIRGTEKEKARIYVGKDSKMMNLLYRLSPSFATSMISKQMQKLLPPL